MIVTIDGWNMPARVFCGPDGSELFNVHVAIQDGQTPMGQVGVSAGEARWQVEVRVIVTDDGGLDFRGSAVHGRKGERFLYLTWGDVGADGTFGMFRRAKLMLNRVDTDLVRQADDSGHLVARVDLTDGRGGPRCARIDPPAIEWSVGPA